MGEKALLANVGVNISHENTTMVSYVYWTVHHLDI